MGLVSSYYTTYSDTGPGWGSYGGATPVWWQFTNNWQNSGCDGNAFKGTPDEWWTLMMGGQVTGPVQIVGGYDDLLPDTVMAMLTGETPRLGFPDLTGPPWDNDAVKNHNLKAVEGRLTQLLADLSAKVGAPAPVDTADLAQKIVAALEQAGIPTGESMHSIMVDVLNGASLHTTA
jgi:hypothetical protein